MNGQEFNATVFGPPPEIMAGQDIHRDLCGVYELTGRDDSCLRYKLRDDDDFLRIKKVHDRVVVMRRLRQELNG